jgi:hypothetical protein
VAEIAPAKLNDNKFEIFTSRFHYLVGSESHGQRWYVTAVGSSPVMRSPEQLERRKPRSSSPLLPRRAYSAFYLFLALSWNHLQSHQTQEKQESCGEAGSGQGTEEPLSQPSSCSSHRFHYL